MTIVRRIYKIPLIGSRVTGDLRPDTDDLPRGINLRVLEYLEAEGMCVIELWGSDITELPPEERCDLAKIDAYAALKGWMPPLTSHPNSPAIIGQIARMRPDGTEEILDEG